MGYLLLPSSNLLLCVSVGKDFHGCHRLNCKQNAGQSNRSAYYLVQYALEQELKRLGLSLSVVDHDREMRQRFSHLS